MDVNSMFASQQAATTLINKLRLTETYTGLEKELLEPAVEQLVMFYHGMPEVTYNPAEDTSGTDYLHIMLFHEDVKVRKFAFFVVHGRMQTLLGDAGGIVTLNLGDKSKELANKGETDMRNAVNSMREVTAGINLLVRTINNLNMVIAPIIMEYPE